MTNDEPPTQPGANPPADAVPPPPPAGAEVPGAQGAPGVPGGQWQQTGIVPATLEGPFYSPGLVILLTIITCGIWGIVWTYRTSEDLKKYNGDGLGGVLGAVVYLLLSIVLMFTIPNEIEKMYQRDGRESPVSPMLGLWFLLPLIGNIIWYVKVQSALNDFWTSKGARPA
jgi:hypothetical protein